MANPQHLEALSKGVEFWNHYRSKNPEFEPDLSDSNLTSYDLKSINLKHGNISNSVISEEYAQNDLTGANFQNADLSNVGLDACNLTNTNLSGANLSGVRSSEGGLRAPNFEGTNLRNATLNNAFFGRASFRRCILDGAIIENNTRFYQCSFDQASFRGTQFSNLELSNLNFPDARFTNSVWEDVEINGCEFVDANFNKAILNNCHFDSCNITGISTWSITYDEATRFSGLLASGLQLDSLEVAQFINLLQDNKKLRAIIDTVTTKVVFILGRFGEETMPILNAISLEIKRRGLLPVIFDFDKPENRSFIETVMTVAHMAYFVIGDFTNARIILQEATEIVKGVAVPFAPILRMGSDFEPITLSDLRVNHRSLLETFIYDDERHLMENLQNRIINPAIEKEKELRSLRQNI